MRKIEDLISNIELFREKQNETIHDYIARITAQDARQLIKSWSALFRHLLLENNVEARQITRLTTKFRDAGRRSPPWQSGSETGNRRPQDGPDGNRQNRWLFNNTHKFYADEVTATLTEIRYFMQTLSMNGAPSIPNKRLERDFLVILGHSLKPGMFLDPIQKIPVEFEEFVNNPTYLESGHYVPLGKGGKHTPDNATLMLRDSNRLQADLTVNELLDIMAGILERHDYYKTHLRK